MPDIEHTSLEQLTNALTDAAKQVPVGMFYAHYKHPDWSHRYEIVGHAIWEATDEVAVLYKATYGITFARPLRVWQERIEWKGQTVPRFVPIQQ